MLQLPIDCRQLILSYLPLAQLESIHPNDNTWKFRYQQRYGKTLYEYEFETGRQAHTLYLIKAGFDYHEVSASSIPLLGKDYCLFAACKSQNHEIIKSLMPFDAESFALSTTIIDYDMVDVMAELLNATVKMHGVTRIHGVFENIGVNFEKTKIHSVTMANLLNLGPLRERFQYLIGYNMPLSWHNESSDTTEDFFNGMAFDAILNNNIAKYRYLTTIDVNFEVYFILDLPEKIGINADNNAGAGPFLLALEHVAVNIMSKLDTRLFDADLFDLNNGFVSLLRYQTQITRCEKMIQFLTQHRHNDFINKYVLCLLAVIGKLGVEDLIGVTDRDFLTIIAKIKFERGEYDTIPVLASVPSIFNDARTFCNLDGVLFCSERGIYLDSFGYALNSATLAQLKLGQIKNKFLFKMIKVQFPALNYLD